MGKSVINVLISGDAKGLQSALDESQTRLQKFGDAGGKTLKTLGTAFAGLSAAALGVGYAMKPLINAAADQGEAVNKMGEIFDESAMSVEAWSMTTAEAFGISQTAALEAASNFGQMGTAAGLTGDELASFGTAMTEAAADVASFNNLTTDEALLKLRSGLAGETEPLRQLGIFFNAAAVEARAFEMGLANAHGEIDDGAKILARQALIMEQLGSQGALGDFARTSDDLANSQRILSARFEDVQADLGKALLPLALKFTEALSGLIDAGQRVAEIIGEEGIGGVFSRLIARFQELSPAVQAGAFVVGGVLVTAFGAWAVAAGAAAVATLAAIAPVVAIGAAIGALAFGFKYAWENSETFRDVVTTTWETIKTVVTVAWEQFIKPVFDTWLRVGQGLVDFFAGVFTGDWSRAWDGIKQIVGAVGEYIKHFFLDLPGKVLGWLAGFGKALFDWFVGPGKDAVIVGMASIALAIGRWFQDLPGMLWDWLSDAGRWLFDIGKAIIGGLWEGMKDKWNSVKDWVGGLGSTIKNLKGPIEVDRVLLVSEGDAIMQGLGAGLMDGFRKRVAPVLQGITGDMSVTGNLALSSAAAAPYGPAMQTPQEDRRPVYLIANEKVLAEVVADANRYGGGGYQR